jgi:hypothetical protein
MTARRWSALAVLSAAVAGVLVGSAVTSDRVLNDPAGYHTRDPALPTPTVTYVRRPIRPLPSDRWIPPPPLETR